MKEKKHCILFLETLKKRKEVSNMLVATKVANIPKREKYLNKDKMFTTERLEEMSLKSSPLFNLRSGSFSHAACNDCCCDVECCGMT